MSMQWTEDQKKVIQHREGNLLVAAAAGSGKTAVLVEHILSRIQDPDDPATLDRMVVMTFTDAAAEEMRQRIKSALDSAIAKNPRNEKLIRQAGSLQNASISTIHSFCKRIIMENYASIQMDPTFRIGDQGELQLLRSDVIENMLEAHYVDAAPQFIRFIDAFASGKEDRGIADLILKVYDYAEASPWPSEYLDSLLTEQDPKQWEDALFSSFKVRAERDLTKLRQAVSIMDDTQDLEEYRPMIVSDMAKVEALTKQTELRAFANAVSSVSFDRLAMIRGERNGKEEVKAIRDSVKKDIGKLAEALTLPDQETEEAAEQAIREKMTVLVGLVREFSDAYQEEKENRHILDFSDLEHRALEILYTGEGGDRHPSDIADSLARNLQEILVDEYQDSNYVQEALIDAISAERFGRPDVFLVGDVKQSIYSFRQARPDLFLAKYSENMVDAAEDGDIPKSAATNAELQEKARPRYSMIELSKNFRSRQEVLTSVNDVFFKIMKKEVGGIDYTEKTALHLGRVVEEDGGIGRKYQTELHIIEVKEDVSRELFDGQRMDKVEAEAAMVGQRIRQLRKEGYHYRDIVILMRAPGGSADTYVETLAGMQIPAYYVSSQGYFDATEVSTVLSLLSVIDNPLQDIPLAAVMRSPIYGFTDEELAEIVAVRGTLQPVAEAETISDEQLTEDVEAATDMYAEDDVVRDSLDHSAEEGSEKENKKSVKDGGASELPEALQKKLFDFYQSLQSFREREYYLSVHELLYRIYDETGYYNYVSAMPGGQRRRANLDALIDSALQFESTSYRGLSDYIRYIEKLRKYDADQGEASIYSDQDELVRIMSIHKSKGLQFPVVFLSGMDKQFNEMDLKKNVLLDQQYGIAFDDIDTETHVRIPTIKRTAVKEKLLTDLLGEEERLLYVAMTRAEDKLILTAAVNKMDNVMKDIDAAGECDPTTIRGAQTMLDWIFMAEGQKLMATGTDAAAVPIYMYTKDLHAIAEEELEVGRENEARFMTLLHDIDTADLTAPDAQYLDERLRYRYPHETATKLFPKHSVSELKEEEIEKFEVSEAEAGREHWNRLDDGSLGKSPAGKTERKADRAPAAGITILADHSDSLNPEGNPLVDDIPKENIGEKHYTEKAGANVGDAYHHAFEKYDYTKDVSQLSEIIPKEEYELIKPSRFEAFLRTDLAEEFKRAQVENKLYREQHFMKEVPNNYLFPDSDCTEPVLLQGIIDAFILDDDGITLVDYKSDHVHDPATLVGRYQKQLDLYADALEKMTGKPIKRKLIYSIILEQVISLK